MPGDLKVYSLEEVSQHDKGDDVWIIIHDKVYDVSKFLDEHPGGEEVLRDMAGHVATENFEDVGHSTDARELMQKYLVGEINEAGKQHTKAKQIVWTQPKPEAASSSWMVYVAVAVVAFLIYLYMS